MRQVARDDLGAAVRRIVLGVVDGHEGDVAGHG